ncbi:MAG: type II toxin-antitoxin system RelE/ParE family toxin [Cyclobacteriaceae bacterium]
MAKINWTVQAKNDLIAIGEFIAQDSAKFSKIQIFRIRDRVKQLKDFPQLGRIVPEFDKETIRELILGNYRIIYKLLESGEIDILTIHHSARVIRH